MAEEKGETALAKVSLKKAKLIEQDLLGTGRVIYIRKHNLYPNEF